MATITSRRGPKGRIVWQAQVRRMGHLSKTRTFNAKSDAEKWARRIERDMDLGRAVAGSEEERITLAEAVERYLHEPSVLSHGGYVAEANRARLLAKSRLGPVRLVALSGADLARYRDERLAAGRAANTVRLDLALLRSLYKKAATEWGLTTLRMPLVAKPRLPAGRTRRLEAGEEERLLAAADSHGGEIGAIIRWALATGMRRGEIAGMRWEDVEFKQRVLRIPRTKDATEERGREVPLSATAMHLLSELPRRLDGQIWTMTPDAISNAFSEVRNRAGVTGIRFHDMRHEATSRFFELGLDSMQVSAITGHKTLSMLKRYTHLRAADLAKRLAQLDGPSQDRATA